ncbi:MAG: peptidase T-like protein [Herbinix sp.]|jgi:tripeptide aminopeptidase|nr:peptidase T-like protein [Herbinix sp.]
MINKERIVKEFCSLVAIDAESFQERAMADALTKMLLELGFTVEEDGAGEYYQGNCGNIYGYLDGELEGDPILFSAHMDTVKPGIHKVAVIQADGRITSDGCTVLGADDVAGIVSIIEAIRTIKEQGIPHRSLEVLFPIAEEVYLKGSDVFDYKKVKAKEAYVLDLDGPVGTAALKAPTVEAFTAKFIGKASHAGFAPEQGINAIRIAAEAITLIQQGRIDEETTANIGLIEGGKAKNIVPEECILRGEVRSLKHEKALSEVANIEGIFRDIAAKNKANLEFETSFGCLAYDIDRNHPVVTRYEKVCKELCYEYRFTDTFGGSDNNNFVRNGITGIVLSCGMHKVHSCEEYTHVEDLVKCCSIVMKLMISRS